MMRLLEKDPIRAAYHLALLSRPYSEHVHWFAHRSPGGADDAAAALYTLNRPPIIFLLGGARGVRRCLDEADLPQFAYAAYFPEHEQPLARHYRTPAPTEMLRMVLERNAFDSIAPALDNYRRRAIVLRPRHAELLEELYTCAPGFRYDPYQFSCGRYIGIITDGRLAAAAGTHFLSEDYSFAMVGNVVTRPDLRRRGFGRAVVLGLLHRLFSLVDTVCLNVSTTNEAAVNLYKSMGFSAHCVYREGASVRRGSLRHAPILAANAPQGAVCGT